MTWGIFFEAGSLCVLNFFHTSGLAPSGGPYSFFTGEERIWKERRRAGREVPPYEPTPWVGVVTTAAHCTEYQADLFLHPSSGLVSWPLAAALALTTQGSSLLAAVAEAFFV